MLKRILDLGQTAVEHGNRAMRLLLDLAMMATEHLRQRVGLSQEPHDGYGSRPIAPPEPAPLAHEPGAEEPEPPAHEPGAGEPASPVEELASRRTGSKSSKPASAKKAPRGTARTSKKAQGSKQTTSGKRPDQMLRVLEILASGEKPWMSAREISEAGEASGKPILPGNVRKVIRGRGKGLVETRPRKGNRRGAMEYRISPAGRKRLQG